MTWVPWKPQGRFRVCLPHRVLGTPPDTLIFPKFPMVLLKGDPASLPSAFQNQLPTWKHLLRLTYTATTVTRLNETLIIPDHIMCHMKTSDPAMGTYKSPSVQLPQSSKSVSPLFIFLNGRESKYNTIVIYNMGEKVKILKSDSNILFFVS